MIFRASVGQQAQSLSASLRSRLSFPTASPIHTTLRQASSTTSTTTKTSPPPTAPKGTPRSKRGAASPDPAEEKRTYSSMQAERRRLASYSRYGPFGGSALKPLHSRKVRGDPVYGTPTEFARSLDTPAAAPGAPLKHLLTPDDVAAVSQQVRHAMNPPEYAGQAHPLTKVASADAAATADEAVRRIASLALGTRADAHRANVQRCIESFGRHVTDYVLPGKPAAASAAATTPDGREDPTVYASQVRAGPDTGSPEVQIAILTSRIRRIANEQAGRGRKDIVARRSLTRLVHRRQQLLRYFYRKERGSPRWENLVTTLGLTDATWKGEINLPRQKGPRSSAPAGMSS